MGDVFSTIGWLFTAKDMASGVATKAQKEITSASKYAMTSFDQLADVGTAMVDFFTDQWGQTIEGAGVILDSFGHVMTDLVKSPFRLFTDASAGLLETLLPIGTAIGKFQASLKAFGKFIVTKEFTFDGIFKSFVKGVPTLVGLIKSKLQPALDAVKARSETLNVTLGAALGKFKSLGKGAVGGLGGLIMGPLGGILKLLQPIIDVVEDALSPAFEIVGETVKNAFGPLKYVMTLVGQTLAPLIQRAMKPIVMFLTLGAVKLASFIQGLAKSKTTLGPVSSLIDTITKTMTALAPVAMRLVDALVKNLAPIAESLVKLGAVLVEKVFAPGLLLVVEGLTDLLENPNTAIFFQVMADGIDYLATSVSTFWGDLQKNFRDFKLLFAPEIQMVQDFGKAIGDLGVGILSAMKPVMDFLEASFGKLLAWVQKALEWAGLVESEEAKAKKAAESAKAVGNAAAEGAEVARLIAAGDTKGLEAFRAAKAAAKKQLPKGAAGGIATGPSIVGEAGPELAIPLRADTLEKVLAPIFPKLGLPGMDDAVKLLGKIDASLRGTIRVVGEGGPNTADARERERQDTLDLESAVGMGGLGAW